MPPHALDLRTLPGLLHDANMLHLSFQPGEQVLHTEWTGCLRADPTTGELLGEVVGIALTGVARVEVALDSADPFARPSSLPEPGMPSVGSLRTTNGFDDWMAIDDPDERHWLAEALHLFPLFAASRGGQAERSVVFPVRADPIPAAYRVQAHVACRGVEPSADGGRLDVAEWARQFETWWDRWSDQHEERDGEHKSGVVQIVQGGIPVRRTAAAARSRLPREPVFELGQCDAPADILQTLSSYFLAWHDREWVELARIEGAENDADVARRVIAIQELRESSAGYGRSVDAWWVEGGRACVTLRGVDYHLPSPADDLPEEALESVWTFGLRRRGARWVITNESQGWPAYGSAPRLARSAKPWLASWKAPEVTSGER